MRHGLVYIGGDKKTWERLSELTDERLEYFSDPKKAAEFIHGDGGGTIAFCGRGDGNGCDVGSIAGLRLRFPKLYMILVTSEALTAEEKRRCLESGINDTVSPDVKKETLEAALAFVMLNQERLLCPENGRATVTETFRLPVWKRAFDVLFSGCALLFLSPLMLAVAAAVRIESRGPVIYRSKRVGSNYHVFDFLKFRSMYADADRRLKQFGNLNQYSATEEFPPPASLAEVIPADGDAALSELQGKVLLVSDDYTVAEHDYIRAKSAETANAFVKFENDPRITRVGRFIRKYSIDELPQLINILKGDMSVVGNRPLPLYEAEKLTADEYVERFMAPAGLTGLWQVEKRGGAGKMSAEERKLLDIEYARGFSPAVDFKILLKTFTAFIQKENV